MDTTINPPRQRLVWADVVRLVAMFAVVCCHCTDPFNFYQGPAPSNIADIRFWGALYGAILRPCVPLFVMLTGALLLPLKEETVPFCRRHISRVLWPFLLWSVVYCLFPWLTGVLGFRPEVLLDFFPYAGEDVMSQSISVSAGYVARIPLNFSAIDSHMWYVYLVIGLYLYLPVFSAWVERASRRLQLGYLALWGITLFVPFYREYVNPYLWGSCSWNEFHMLSNFAGFNGYLLLGHYLRHTDWSRWKTFGIGVPMFAVGLAVAFFGFRHITSLPHYTDEQLELFFYYCSPQVVLMSVAVFMMMRCVRVESPLLKRMLANLTRCGFGVYMVHYFFIGPSVLLVRALSVPLCVQIPVAAVLAFAVTWVLVNTLRRLTGRYARYVVG